MEKAENFQKNIHKNTKALLTSISATVLQRITNAKYIDANKVN